jgi:hypothetical protein
VSNQVMSSASPPSRGTIPAMLRALLVGLLGVAAVGCKSGGDSPKSLPGVAAGKVVEVTGAVMVRHNDVAQPLVKGATLDGDDVIETGADGNAIIELSHNLARLELGPNKKSKLRESAAWNLDKKSGDVAVVQQDTAAAGRPAERSAADTSVSATAESAKAEGAPAPPAAAPAAEQAQSPRAESPPKPKRDATATKGARAGTADKDDMFGGVGDVRSGAGGGSPVTTTRGGGAAASADLASDKKVAEHAAVEKKAGMSPAEADKAAMDVVVANMKSLSACLTKDAQAVSVSIKIAANGKATAVVTGKAAVPGSVQSCMKSAVAKMKFATAATTVKVEVSK